MAKVDENRLLGGMRQMNWREAIGFVDIISEQCRSVD